MLSFLYVYSDHSILECYNLFSGVELSMRSFFVICNLASSIEITYMPVAIEPRRFGKHKIYHIILQEVRKQSFGSHSLDS